MSHFFSRKEDDEEKLWRDLMDISNGKKIAEMYPTYTTEQLATRARQIVEYQISLRKKIGKAHE